MKKIVLLIVMLGILTIPNVLAGQGHMRLLAVRESDSGFEGGTADLYLEIKPGSGRVFIDTFPLTRTDTQMSTRFAKAIACDIIERDCSDTDFFYTITADSAIIAGPSAGASIAVLTVAMLENYGLNENYAITGTINSGGLIGPVGGLKAKVEAAKAAGLKKVLIPAGELIATYNNSTVNLKNLSRELKIQVEEVSSLGEAVKEFTGKEISQKFRKISINEDYTATMKLLARDLCERSSKLKAQLGKIKPSADTALSMELANNLSIKGKEAFEKQTFYSSASYCFGANVELSNLLLVSKNLTKSRLLTELKKSEDEISGFYAKTDSFEKKTITDLEAYIVIKERLAEAQDSINYTRGILNDTKGAVRSLAYAGERINSAYSWASFLGKTGRAFNLNKDVLRNSCQNKISEAYERMQYVELYFPNTLDNIKKETEKANAEFEKGNYELCLSMASKAKADVDIILTVFGVSNDQYGNIIQRKLDIVKDNIARESARGIFPILGYSYYEYANSLKNTDIFSALLYSEYALEFSNLDIYFKDGNVKSMGIKMGSINAYRNKAGLFLLGALAGVAITYLIQRRNAAKSSGKNRMHNPSRRK